MDQELKKKLNLDTAPEYSRFLLEKTVEEARRISRYPGRRLMDKGEFFLDQIRFVRPFVWGIKAGITFFLLLFLADGNGINQARVWTAVSLAGPLFCLFNARGLWEICCPGMREIQMTAKYSLQNVVLVRLILFGGFDAAVLLLAALVLKMSENGAVWQIILYGTVPYFAMCAGGIFIFRKYREADGMLYCCVWGVLLAGIMAGMRVTGWHIYGQEAVPVWIAAGTAALAATVWETRLFIKQSGGNMDEVNVGTAV